MQKVMIMHITIFKIGPTFISDITMINKKYLIIFSLVTLLNYYSKALLINNKIKFKIIKFTFISNRYLKW